MDERTTVKVAWTDDEQGAIIANANRVGKAYGGEAVADIMYVLNALAEKTEDEQRVVLFDIMNTKEGGATGICALALIGIQVVHLAAMKKEETVVELLVDLMIMGAFWVSGYYLGRSNQESEINIIMETRDGQEEPEVSDQ